jgi:hypothetical protein
MAGSGNGFEPRASDRRAILLATDGRHDSILRAPHDQSWRADPTNQLRQRLVVHIWLISDAAGHFAINFPLLELIERGLGGVQFDVFVLIVGAAESPSG